MPPNSYSYSNSYFVSQGSVWAGSFTGRLTDKELQQLFTSLVLVAALDKTPHQRVRLLRLGTTYHNAGRMCFKRNLLQGGQTEGIHRLACLDPSNQLQGP